MDDFFIEDILNTTQRGKKVNSKDKGRRGELELCKILSKRFGGSFFRVVGSGNRWSQVTLTEHAKEVLTGDVVCPASFAFAVECKYGYADIDLCTAFSGHKELDKFLEQAEKDADRVGKKPLLCWRKPRQPWLAFLKEDFVTDYKLYYRDWVGYALTDVLAKPDEFFFIPKSSSTLRSGVSTHRGNDTF